MTPEIHETKVNGERVKGMGRDSIRGRDTADIAESLNLCDNSIKFELSSPRLGNEPRPPPHELDMRAILREEER